MFGVLLYIIFCFKSWVAQSYRELVGLEVIEPERCKCCLYSKQGLQPLEREKGNLTDLLYETVLKSDMISRECL